MARSLLLHYGEHIAVYTVTGTLTLEGKQAVLCTLEAGQLRNGSVLLLCFFSKFLLPPVPLPISGYMFEGITGEGYSISITERIEETNYLPEPSGNDLLEVAFDVNRMLVQLVGNGKAHRAHYGITNFVYRNDFSLTLQHLSDTTVLAMKRVQNYEKITDRLLTLKDIDVTCEVVGDIPANGYLEQLQRVVNDLCYLLSVAQGVKIVWVYCYQYDEDGICISKTHVSSIAKRYGSLQIVGARWDEMKVFIEGAYSSYVAQREGYKLDAGTIGVYLDAKAEGDYLQLRGIKLAVTMEALKYVFLSLPLEPISEKVDIPGLDEEVICKIRMAVRTVLTQEKMDIEEQNAICGKCSVFAPKKHKRHFGEVLKDIFKRIDLHVEEKDRELFVECRNALVHTGHFYCEVATLEQRKKHKPLPSGGDEYFFLVNILDKVFLKMLGYNGPYTDWSSLRPVYQEHV